MWVEGTPQTTKYKHPTVNHPHVSPSIAGFLVATGAGWCGAPPKSEHSCQNKYQWQQLRSGWALEAAPFFLVA